MDIEFNLLTISEKETHPIEARKAFTEIYEYYRLFLFNAILKKVYYKSHKEEFSQTILNEVFHYVWNNPLKWEFNSQQHKNQDSAFKAYLSSIANYKVLEHLKKHQPYILKETNQIDDENNDWIFKLKDEEYETLELELSQKNNLLDEIISNLDEKKRDILRVYFYHYEDGKRMKNEVIKSMELMFDTTWDNIRQIISRTKKVIKEKINKAIKVQ